MAVDAITFMERNQAPAPAPGPMVDPQLPGWEVTFELENYNYFDLQKGLVVAQPKPEEPKAKKLEKPTPQSKSDPGFWTNVRAGLEKTGGQADDLPEKIGDEEREGLYPVDLTKPRSFETRLGRGIAKGTSKTAGQAEKASDGEEVQEVKVEKVKATQVKEVKVEKTVKKEESPPPTQAPEEAAPTVQASSSSSSVTSGFSKTTAQIADALSGEGGPSHGKAGEVYPVDLTDPSHAALLQTQVQSYTSKCMTAEGIIEDTCVVDVLRDSIHDAFLDLIETSLDTKDERDDVEESFFKPMGWVKGADGVWAPAGTPAPAPAPAPALLQVRKHGGAAPGPAAPGPAPGPAEEYKVDVFVQFYPGDERPVVEDAGEVGRSTIVKVFIQGKPNTNVNELFPWIEAVLKRHEQDGLMQALLEKRLFDATAIEPTMDGFECIKMNLVQQWSLQTCEAHMKKIVKEFSCAYTRRMVPTAIYNECTNFVAEVSFSHDHVFDVHDRMRCRHATVKLSKEWNFGKGHAGPGPAPAPAPAPGPAAPVAAAAPAAPGGPAGPASANVDYLGFCAEVCEIKYGEDAPMCHVTEGKKLFDALMTP